MGLSCALRSAFLKSACYGKEGEEESTLTVYLYKSSLLSSTLESLLLLIFNQPAWNAVQPDPCPSLVRRSRANLLVNLEQIPHKLPKINAPFGNKV